MKPSPPNRPDAELFLKRDADADALGGGEERVLLRDELAADLREVHRRRCGPDRARRTRPGASCVLRFRNTVMNSDSPVSSRLPAPISAPRKPLFFWRAVTEDRLHLDAVFHEHHAAGFGDGRFVRIELHLHELQVVANDSVLDLVHVGHVGSSTR